MSMVRSTRLEVKQTFGLEVWLVFWTLILTMMSKMLTADNLPLLSGTLRTFQVHACDGNELKIECFPNTVISINLVQYGRPVPSFQLCPPETLGDTYFLRNDSNICLSPEALRAVEAACREQQVCKMRTSPESLGGDPCPGVRKYAEVAYKCRPDVFYNEIACEGQRLRLRCSKSMRIVIYSASFGGTRFGVPECLQQESAGNQDCQVSYATETVLRSCLGKRKCSVAADKDTFGDPSCSRGSSLFLKVVYTCVPKEILRDPELDLEKNKNDLEDDHKVFQKEASYDSTTSSSETGDHHSKGIQSTAIQDLPPVEPVIPVIKSTPKTDMQSDENMEGMDINCTVIEGDKKVVGFLTEWFAAYKFISENKEKCILYLTLSLGAGLMVFLSVLAFRLYIQKRRERKRADLHISEPLPSAFVEDSSDLDHFDTSNRPDNNIEVVRFTSTSTMRRQDSDTNPRAPMSRNVTSYDYYS
ncbi:protein eva-1-like isoform X2 [Tachypleus tridentatus]|uniref:protein eva-1-like isoform X2 n=1 Tax=Tachypleus tridentatus TaxID=6853 RepID=UPI003FD59C0F